MAQWQSTKGHNSWIFCFRIYSKVNQVIFSSLPIYSLSYEALAPTVFEIFCWQGKMPKFTKGHSSCPETIGPFNFLLTYFFSWGIHIWNFKTLAYMVFNLWFEQESNNIKWPEISKGHNLNKNFMKLFEKLIRWSPLLSQSVHQISRL